MQTLGIYQIAANPADLASGATIGSYLVDAAGALLTSTAIGGKQRLDVNDVASHIDGSAYAAAADYLMSAGAVDESGNWQPLNINAAGELLVNAAVTFTAEHSEDSPASSGDSGIFTLLVRQDMLASSTSADGDYGAFKSNAKGELYVKDADVLAELVLIQADTAAIAASTASIDTKSTSIVSNTSATAASVASIDTKSTTIASNTGTTATNTGSIASLLTALSKAEDAVHSSGDQGIQALAVRKDAQGSNVSADGDYASLQVWSEGSLKVVNVANGALLQQQVAVGNTATACPASALPNRKTIMLQNTGLTTAWIGSGTVAITGAAAGIQMPASSFMELECGPAVTVYARAAVAAQLNILEMA